MRVQTLSPLVLSSSALIGNGIGPVGVADIEALKNPSRTAYLVEEIRIRVNAVNLDPLVSGNVPIASLGVKLSVGRLQLTGGQYIPLGLLCKPLDITREIFTFTWRLPKPFYVPGAEPIVPSFILPAPLGTANVPASPQKATIFITYLGRTLSTDTPNPTSVNVPYVTAWQDALRPTGVDYKAVRSIRSDLKNRYGELYFVQRMTGGAVLAYPANPAEYTGRSSYDGFGVVDQFVNDYVKTQAFKSDGSIVARDQTPWQQLFPGTTRGTDMMTVLARNEFYQLSSDILASNLAAGGTIQLMAALVGYRKVKYANVTGYGYLEDNS